MNTNNLDITISDMQERVKKIFKVNNKLFSKMQLFPADAIANINVPTMISSVIDANTLNKYDLKTTAIKMSNGEYQFKHELIIDMDYALRVLPENFNLSKIISSLHPFIIFREDNIKQIFSINFIEEELINIQWLSDIVTEHSLSSESYTVYIKELDNKLDLNSYFYELKFLIKFDSMLEILDSKDIRYNTESFNNCLLNYSNNRDAYLQLFKMNEI